MCLSLPLILMPKHSFHASFLDGCRRLRATGKHSGTRMTCGTRTRCALAGATAPCPRTTHSPVHRPPTAAPTPSPTQTPTASTAAWEGQSSCGMHILRSDPEQQTLRHFFVLGRMSPPILRWCRPPFYYVSPHRHPRFRALYKTTPRTRKEGRRPAV